MKHVEEYTQTQCVRWFGYQYPALARLLHHSPNGGRRSAIEGARFKAMGTRAGFPDLFLFVPSGGYHGLAVEMKTDKGKQSAAQKEMEAALSAQGYRYAVARSFDDFRVLVSGYLL